MHTAQKGAEVKVHYTGKLTTGEIFDSSVGRDPLSFTVGAGMMIAGFDAGVLHMAPGDKKTIEIPANEAYGGYSEDQVFDFPRANVPADMQLEPGMQLTLKNDQGMPVPVLVLEVKEDVIVMDANHSLAGKDLIFEIEMIEVNGQGKSLIIMP